VHTIYNATFTVLFIISTAFEFSFPLRGDFESITLYFCSTDSEGLIGMD